MMRAGSLAAVVAAASLLSGCGGQSPYCAAIETGQTRLDSFGAKRTDADFAAYAKTVDAVAKAAPEDTTKKVSDQWTALAKATDAVVAAQDEAGIKLEDMDDADARQGLDQAGVDRLNEVYDAFNAAVADNQVLVSDAQDTCDITLK